MDKFTPKTASKTFLWSMFLPQALLLIAICILSIFYKDLESLENSWFYIFSCVVIAQLSFAIIYFRVCKKKNISIKQEVTAGCKKLSLKNVLFCMLISVIAIIGLFYFVGLFDNLFGLLGYVEGEPLLPNNTIPWLLLNILLSAVIPAILEETIFRHIIFKGLKDIGFWFASIVSSIMFMLVHLSLGSVAYPILMGIIFCLVVRKTGSVVYSVIVHFCNNLIALIIQYIQNITGKKLLPSVINLWWEILLVIAIAIISYLVMLLIIKYCLKNKNQNERTLNYSTQEVSNKNFLVATNSQINWFSKKAIVIYSLLIGFAFWLIIILSSL